MDRAHTYDLAFVAPKRRPRTAPEIVFIINERYMPEVVERLHKLTGRFFGYANAQLGEDNAGFMLPIPDLFGNKEFGYRNCGYWTTEDGEVHLRLQLRPYPWTLCCSLSIFMLVRALGFPFEEGCRQSNRVQDVALLTNADRYSGGYGHAVTGWISGDILGWLKDYAKNKVRELGIMEAAPMHPDVIRAQQAAWHAISNPEMKKYAGKCYIHGWVRDSGAFTMNCFGDACDLSVYPDQISEGEMRRSVELGCHNLDNADQQLTLLAGLAKICQLARESS